MLTGKQRRALRALAHELNPVVQVGHQGLSESVLKQVDSALTTHELIKVKLQRECPVGPGEIAGEIEAGTRSDVAQIIGRVLVVYRRHPKKPKIVLPSPERRAKRGGSQ